MIEHSHSKSEREINSHSTSILVTGGLGFIGSHIVAELLSLNKNSQKYKIIIIDNLSNSKLKVYETLKKFNPESENLSEIPNDLIKIISPLYPAFKKGDIRDKFFLEGVFREFKIDTVIHLAGLKSVSESKSDPLLYYENNVCGTINLLNVMKKFNVKNFIFSSSATVYGGNNNPPFSENSPCGIEITNPYGKSKFMVEEILRDFSSSSSSSSHNSSNAHSVGINIVILRYFNPVGGHESGLLKEEPRGVPNNLMPYIIKVAEGKMPHLNVYGTDYPTPDGTGVRDFIHVVDLAKGHISCLKLFEASEEISSKSSSNFKIYNLGTGRGHSVLEVVRAFERVNNVKIPVEFKSRREGDVEVSVADPKLIYQELGWKTERGLDEMVRM